MQVWLCVCSMGLVSPLINERPCFNQQTISLRRKVYGNLPFWESSLVLWIMNTNRICPCHCHWQSVRDISKAGMSSSLEASCHTLSEEQGKTSIAKRNFEVVCSKWPSWIFGGKLWTLYLLVLKGLFT